MACSSANHVDGAEVRKLTTGQCTVEFLSLRCDGCRSRPALVLASKVLLLHKADPNAQKKDGQPQAYQTFIVDFLSRSTHFVSLRLWPLCLYFCVGTSSVYLAVLNNAAETLELLLESKASPDVSRVPDGVTAVSMAAQKNHVESLLVRI